MSTVDIWDLCVDSIFTDHEEAMKWLYKPDD